MTTPERNSYAKAYAVLIAAREATDRAVLATELAIENARSRVQETQFLVADIQRDLETQRTFLQTWKRMS